jgi:hypothetical protein
MKWLLVKPEVFNDVDIYTAAHELKHHKLGGYVHACWSILFNIPAIIIDILIDLFTHVGEVGR